MFQLSRPHVLGALASLAMAAPAFPATITVPTDELTVQAAIDAALNGDEVVIAPGTYAETIDFGGKAITVRSTNPDDPAVVAATVIDAGQAGAVVTFDEGEGSDSILAGLTITGGSSAFGGGIRLPPFAGSSPKIVACVITANSGGSNGGGVYCDVGNAGPSLERCIISGNDATEGGGVFVNGAATLRNCLIVGNTASRGGGIHAITSSVTVTNCTIADNIATNVGLGAGVRTTSGTTTIVNSILWGNTDGGANEQIVDFDDTVSFSDVQFGFTGDGGNNLSADPLFVDDANGDYRLGAGSPCIDAGDDAAASGLTVDLDGNDRFQDGDCDLQATVDMGCYEAATATGSPPSAVLGTEQLLGLAAQGVARLDASLSAGEPDETLTFVWHVVGPTTNDFSGPSVIDVYLDYGCYTITVDVTGDCGTATTSTTLTVDPDELAVFEHKKADVRLDDGEVKISGEIGLPFGVDFGEVAPQIDATLSLGGVLLLDELVTLDVEGGQQNKWRYENDLAGAGQITKLDVDWKGARYRFKDFGLDIKSVLISADEATLELKYKMDEIGGPFTVGFDGVVVDVDAAGTATCVECTAFAIEKPGKEVVLTIPVPLADSSVLTLGGVLDAIIMVADDMRESVGRFKLEALVDPGLIGDPPSIDLAVMVGGIGPPSDEGYPGAISIPTGEIDVEPDKWKAKK